MTTKTKSKSKRARTSSTKKAEVPERTVVDSPIGDLPAGDVKIETDDGTVTPQNDPRADALPTLNGFVSVVGGEHAGRYGAAQGTTRDGKQVVVITRDDDNERIVVNYYDLRPDRAGRR